MRNRRCAKCLLRGWTTSAFHDDALHVARNGGGFRLRVSASRWMRPPWGDADYRRNPSFSISARYLSGWVLLK
jgi:hypothetical protein